MSIAIIDAALEPLALSPANAARFLSISKRSLSRLIARKKIAARKDGARTLVDPTALGADAVTHGPIALGHGSSCPNCGKVVRCRNRREGPEAAFLGL